MESEMIKKFSPEGMGEFKSCFNNCSCNYESFIKEAVCMHLLGYSTIHDLDLCGEAYSTKPKTKLDKKSSNLCVKPIF